jgi:hypothetical protein
MNLGRGTSQEKSIRDKASLKCGVCLLLINLGTIPENNYGRGNERLAATDFNFALESLKISHDVFAAISIKVQRSSGKGEA